MGIRKSFLFVCLAMILLCGNCFASQLSHYNKDDHVLQPDEVALGGIMVGTTRNEVESIYGKPTNRSGQLPNKMIGEMEDIYTYGNSFKITFIKDKVMYVDTKAKNGIATPSDVKVGDIKANVLVRYGKPWHYWEGKDGSQNYVYRDTRGIHILFATYNGAVRSIDIVGYE